MTRSTTDSARRLWAELDTDELVDVADDLARNVLSGQRTSGGRSDRPRVRDLLVDDLQRDRLADLKRQFRPRLAMGYQLRPSTLVEMLVAVEDAEIARLHLLSTLLERAR